MNRLMKWWRGDPAPVPEPVQPRSPMEITREALAFAQRAPRGPERSRAFMDLFPMPPVPPGVPEDVRKMAMDDMSDVYGYMGQCGFGTSFPGGGLTSFPGYAYLAELSQRPEYRNAAETFAKELTRKWITLTTSGEDDKTDKIGRLNEAIEKFKLQEHFQRVAEHDGLFGRGQIYIDTGDGDRPEELKTPLIVDKAKIRPGSLLGFRVIEPIWTYPNVYNTRDPLRADYFRPTTWFVQGKLLHHSRLMIFVSRELPDLLKPSYSFGGLSLTQIMKPYVDNWLRTRQSVSDLLHTFSILILATNMGSNLNAGAAQMMNARAQYAIGMRDNQGLQMIDKDTEEMTNIAVPLGTIDALQAQAQEQMASVSGIPLVKLLGITPSGLNASSDGEIRVFYDRVSAMQEMFFRPHLKRALDVIQLSEFGEIDADIGFKFNPLWQLDDAGRAAVRKIDADTDVELINAGVLAPIESRQRLAADDDSPYSGLDVDDLPEPPIDPAMEVSDPDADGVGREGEAGETAGANSGV